MIRQQHAHSWGQKRLFLMWLMPLTAKGHASSLTEGTSCGCLYFPPAFNAYVDSGKHLLNQNDLCKTP